MSLINEKNGGNNFNEPYTEEMREDEWDI